MAFDWLFKLKNSSKARRTDQLPSETHREPVHFIFAAIAVRPSPGKPDVGVPVGSPQPSHGVAPQYPYTMISRFITEVTTKFNPFSRQAKAARLFLTFLP